MEKFSKKELLDIERARNLAILAHEGQTRDEGTPYFEHVARVATKLSTLNLSPSIIIIGYLHDTIEDTYITHLDLVNQFGPTVANAVEVLTKTKGINLADYLKKIVDYPDIGPSYIKIADRIDNICSLKQCPSKDKVNRYIYQTESVFLPCMMSSLYRLDSTYNSLINELKSTLEEIKNFYNK